MNDEPNLYAPPSASIGGPVSESEVFDLRLFFRWEKLRLAYNGILAVETAVLLVIMPPPRSTLASLPLTLAFCCLMANACFCVGPVLDGYARWIGSNQRYVTLTLFITGMILACGLTLGVVLLLNYPNLAD
ncbi:hypothetical protein P12x_001000 [Tundrisphaera lichenicola]|uniref:hypothetical protein n=1 Tax=Tundrisphaera lichenicola TaxID=2029860 RepID=UPI003EBFCACC